MGYAKLVVKAEMGIVCLKIDEDPQVSNEKLLYRHQWLKIIFMHTPPSLEEKLSVFASDVTRG